MGVQAAANLKRVYKDIKSYPSVIKRTHAFLPETDLSPRGILLPDHRACNDDINLFISS